MRRYLTTLSWISKIIKALENVFDVTDAEQGGMISTDEYENPEFNISAMCRVLQINRSGYYAWKAWPAPHLPYQLKISKVHSTEWKQWRRADLPKNKLLVFLKEAEAGSPVADICRRGGFSDATFYKWRAKFGGMEAT